MLLPISWLKDYVNLDNITTEELANSLFECGFEVEEIKKYSEEISNVVVGLIKKIDKHTNSDHLQIVILDCGKGLHELQIVTGAHNIKVGDYVPVALNGSTLPGGIKIKKGNLRGIESNGMLCGGSELGIDDCWYDGASVDGIMILNEPYELGLDIKKVLQLDDEVLEVSITANRPDCQSVYGLAREVACYFKRECKSPEINYETKKSNLSFSLTVEASDICPRYLCQKVEDVVIKSSPYQIRRRLKLCGINSINNFVDITNYILLELGQPLHAFDFEKIEGQSMVVRRAKENEIIVLLDENEISLNNDVLVICDSIKPLCIAGVMGGLNSGIDNNTKSCLFESAKFSHDSIRKTSRALGINSQSSAKFSKGVDEYTTELAIKRALHFVWINKYGTIIDGLKDFGKNENKKNKTIKTTFEKINSVLGIDVDKDIVCDILTRLNFTLKVYDNNIEAVAPEYRQDVENYPDLAEEVIRIYGYSHIVPKLMDSLHITKGGYGCVQEKRNHLMDYLVSNGYFELYNYSFFSNKDLENLSLPKEHDWFNTVKIQNPISNNYAIMRTTLVSSMASIISHNIKLGNECGRFFELVNVFLPLEQPVVNIPNQKMRLCLGIYGSNEDFFGLKGIIESILSLFKGNIKFAKQQQPFLHSGISAGIFFEDVYVGYIGKLSYETMEKFEISKDVYVCELDLEMIECLSNCKIKYKNISSFTDTKRDICLTVPETVENSKIEVCIKNSCKKISEICLFDLYKGPNVADGCKSMTYTISFQNGNEKLTAEQVDKFVNDICTNLQTQYNISMRI